eukprot:scaffold171415_cov13-Prasinocladus_malaysianus.AAC.1
MMRAWRPVYVDCLSTYIYVSTLLTDNLRVACNMILATGIPNDKLGGTLLSLLSSTSSLAVHIAATATLPLPRGHG